MTTRLVLAVLIVVGFGAPAHMIAQEAGSPAAQEAAVPGSNPAALELQPDGTVGKSGMTPEELDAATADVAAELRCLVCRGQSILESQVQLAQDMRALTKELLADGNTPDEVRGYFVARYGEYVMLRPSTRGWNWIVYVFPFAAIVIGAFVLHSRMRRWAGSSDEERLEDPVNADEGNRPIGGEADPTAPEFSDENERWLAEALRGK
jgi:cytochrome c-type biogenesis protein CcmH